MIDVILITLPVYLIVSLGFICVRTGYFPSDGVSALGKFTMRVCMPALMFSAITKSAGDGALFNWPAMVAYGAASIIVILFGVVVMRKGLGQDGPLAWIFALGMGAPNSGFMGLPIVTLLLGSDIAARFFAMAVIVENTVILPLGILAASMAAREGGGWRDSVQALFQNAMRNPLLIAVVVALAVRFSGLPVPEPVRVSLSMLAVVAPAVALFAVGAAVAAMTVSANWRRSTAVVTGKLIVHPIVMFGMAMLIPGIPADLFPVAILFAAMPMVSIFPLLAEPYDGTPVAATSVIGATVLSFLTVSFLSMVLL